MEVRRVEHDNGGSHIEPPLDQTWDKAKKLDWKAAVTAADSGLGVKITHDTGGRQMPWIRYTIMVGSSSAGPFDFGSAWSYLSGVTVGAAEAGRLVSV